MRHCQKAGDRAAGPAHSVLGQAGAPQGAKAQVKGDPCRSPGSSAALVREVTVT